MARIKGTSGNDNLVGTASNDTLIGGSGNDNLSGGTGTDTAQYAGNIADYRFSNVDGKLVVTNDAEGKDTLTSVETLQLGNGQLSLTSGQLLVSANNVDSFTNVISKHITTLADGGFVVAWTSPEQEGEFGDGSGVFAQRFDALGVAQGSEFLVNTTITLEQYEPSITALADGGFVVTWTGGFVSDADIFAQRFDASGNKQGAEFVVNTTTALNQDASNVIALADGSFVVIWHSNDTGGIGVFAQRFDVNGNKLGTEFQVNTELTNHQYYPDITTLVDGGFVITWASLEQDGSLSGIFAQRYDASGAAQGLEFQVNTYTTSDQFSSKVTALSNGGFVITWISQGQDSDGWGIYAQRYDANGNKQGTEFQVNTYTPSNQFVSGITTLVDGGFVVTWQSALQDGDGNGVYAQRYDASGNRLGNEFRVNTDTIGIQSYAGITALADGGFVVDWTSRNPSNAAGTIYAQRYDAAGNAVGLKLTGTNNTEIINLDAGTAGLVVDGLAG
ncbi:MAG: hypothetical protein HOP21_00800, partial [Methylotenera sp.]|nr:hypothetical protein [Methylotenera sp.]